MLSPYERHLVWLWILVFITALAVGIGVAGRIFEWNGLGLFCKTLDVIAGLGALYIVSLFTLLCAEHLWSIVSPPKWVSLQDVRSGEELARLRGPRGDQWIGSLSFSPCGKFLAGGGTDHRAYLWSVPSGALLRKFRELGSTPDWDESGACSVVFTPDGRALIGGYGEEPIQYWDVETGRQIKEVANEVGRVACLVSSPDRSLVVLGSSHDDGFFAVLLNADAGRPQARLEAETYSGLCSLAIAPDNERLACVVGSCEIQMWQIKNERLLWKSAPDGATLSSLALSPDGQTLASSSKKHGLQLWDAVTGKSIHNVAYECAMHRLAFSPDGRTLAACGSDGKVRMLDTTTWKEKFELSCADIDAPIAFSPDGRFLAVLNER